MIKNIMVGIVIISILGFLFKLIIKSMEQKELEKNGLVVRWEPINKNIIEDISYYKRSFNFLKETYIDKDYQEQVKCSFYDPESIVFDKFNIYEEKYLENFYIYFIKDEKRIKLCRIDLTTDLFFSKRKLSTEQKRKFFDKAVVNSLIKINNGL